MFFNRSLSVGLLCLLLTFCAHAQALKQKVSLDLKQVSIQAALGELHTRYGVQFSYINNDLPAGQLVNLQVKNTPVKEVMDQLLAPTRLGYAEHNGRIIISRNLPKPAAKSVPKPAPVPPVKEKPSQPQPRQPADEAAITPVAPEEREMVAATEVPAEPAVEVGPEEQEEPVLAPPTRLHASLEKSFFDKIKTSLQKQNEDYHFGVIYPLSTHGTEAGNYVNKLSLHLLIGTAAGLTGFEGSGIGNIENDFVKGVQVAGMFNVVKNDVAGIQGAGLFNFSGDSVHGGQFAGFANVSRNQLKGVQAAGFANLSGDVQGAQFAGFGNFATYVQGAQFGGFGNIAGIISRGSQFSGFGNIVKQINGSQVSGFGNISGAVQGLQLAGFANLGQRVEGAQISGFLNVAQYVKGVQVGFINLADSVDGVPIGFFSFVRSGYHSLEVWTADDLEANIALKLGVERFYNIFYIGSQVRDPQRWGLGYGVGSMWRMGKRMRLSTDLISMQLSETGINEGWPNEQRLNLVNKFRLLAGWQFARRFSIFAGPTYNLMVSQHKTADGSIGSQLPDHTFYNETFSGKTNIKMWIGVNAGIRF